MPVLLPLLRCLPLTLLRCLPLLLPLLKNLRPVAHEILCQSQNHCVCQSFPRSCRTGAGEATSGMHVYRCAGSDIQTHADCTANEWSITGGKQERRHVQRHACASESERRILGGSVIQISVGPLPRFSCSVSGQGRDNQPARSRPDLVQSLAQRYQGPRRGRSSH